MKTIYGFYAANRYWPDADKLNNAYKDLLSRFPGVEAYLLTDGVELEASGDCLVVVPMSGAVQAKILKDVVKFDKAILYGAYIDSNASEETCDQMIRGNAAPTLMDTWAVLHRTSNNVMIARNVEELNDKLNVLDAYFFVKGANVLKIGETEPWVVSNASSTDVYEKRFGVNIICVKQEELAELYNSCSKEDGKKYYDYFVSNASGCEEPSDEDLWNASKMAYSLVTLMDKYDAKACAIACFNLLKTGTTSCLGVSYLNDCTDKSVSCECDMDSAITMLLLRKLTKSNLWMANPALRSNGLINFSHCTGPIHMNGKCDYILRSHHESQIGVSLQIEYPINQVLTSVRISNEASQITVLKAHSTKGERLNCCRSQVYVDYEDKEKYLNTALGCHQIFAFDDIVQKVKDLANLFGLQVL